ncbi:hypothetical protein JQM63_01815 [Oscillibacter valericigenes]|nr:hypothetical protein [Oscillibacter valericigenes]
MRKKKERKQKSAPVKGKKKIIIIAAVLLVAVAALIAFKLLGGKGEEGEKKEEIIEPEVIEAPMLYELGDLKLPALPVLNADIVVTKEEVPGLVPAEEEQPVVLETADQEKPDEGSDEKSDEEPEEKPEPVIPVANAFHYEGLRSAASVASAYTTLLTDSAVGFYPVDSTLQPAKLPEFDTDAGSVQLVMKAEEDGFFYSFRVEWSEDGVTLIPEKVEGSLPEPPQPVEMTLSDATSYMRYRIPSLLGVSADDVQNYRIYVEDGKVIINGTPCLRFKICRENPQTGGNENSGDYYLSSDRRHIYRLDVETNAVEEVDLSAP